jgi:hypothetical protein
LSDFLSKLFHLEPDFVADFVELFGFHQVDHCVIMERDTDVAFGAKKKQCDVSFVKQQSVADSFYRIEKLGVHIFVVALTETKFLHHFLVGRIDSETFCYQVTNLRCETLDGRADGWN